jgi:hypothetical protein
MNQPIIQKAAAANVQRIAAPVSGLIHNGRRNFNAFILKPPNIFETAMLTLASSFLFLIFISIGR